MIVLLDTCALIWLANGDFMAPASVAAIDEATAEEGVLVSPVSGWEIGLLASSKKGLIRFDPTPQEWLSAFLSRPGVHLAPFTADMGLEASFLPGQLHSDPGDRLLITTARHLDALMITRDHRILEYGKAGFLRVLSC